MFKFKSPLTREEESYKQRMQNALYTLSQGNYEISMLDRERQRIADLGRYFCLRKLKKKELMHNVEDIVEKIDEKVGNRDLARYDFWKHQ